MRRSPTLGSASLVFFFGFLTQHCGSRADISADWTVILPSVSDSDSGAGGAAGSGLGGSPGGSGGNATNDAGSTGGSAGANTGGNGGTTPDGCPVMRPTDGTRCADRMTCTYDTEDCRCSRMAGMNGNRAWTCQDNGGGFMDPNGCPNVEPMDGDPCMPTEGGETCTYVLTDCTCRFRGDQPTWRCR